MDMKKISAACATAAALAALCVPGAAFAADGTLTLNAGDGSTLAGHSFTVYKLANYNDVVKDGANVKSVSASSPDAAADAWVKAALNKNGVTYNTSEGRNAAEQLLRLQTNSNTLRKVAGTLQSTAAASKVTAVKTNQTSTTGSLNLTLPEGYYLVVDAQGIPILVSTTIGGATRMSNGQVLGSTQIKTNVTKIDKKIKSVDGTWKDSAAATNGETRDFKATFTVPNKLAVDTITLEDHMTGITYIDGSFHASVDGTDITNQFGGTLHEYIGKKQALELMEYVDEINVANGGEGTHLYSTGATPIKKLCLENDLHLLDASVRHLGTDKNLVVLEHLYNRLKDRMDIYFDTPVQSVERTDGGYRVVTDKGSYDGRYCVISVGRSGSKWMEQVCRELDIATKSNRVDIGVRVELPYEVFAHLTDELYESKIVYRTEKFQDRVRTFCMNPKGAVVNENTNGIVTVNGHSYEDPAMHTENTNFALLVAKHFSEPFKDSNGYGESIARLSNMLGGGVIIQRFGDLIRGQRSTPKRIEESFVTPTLSATPGDLSLVMPKRILDGIIEMIYALDKIAPGTANDDTLLYGVEVKFYNMEVQLDNNLQTCHPGLFVIGDGSGVTHSLSHASASGVYVARYIAENA